MKLLEVFRVRAVLLLGAGLALSSAGAQGQSISNKSLEEYRVWAKGVYPERDVALAVAPNGSWAAGSGFTKSQAKQKALNSCKYSQYNPTNATCRIVDVNLKRVDTSVATTTSNSSSPGWCATKYTVFESTGAYCNTKGGEWSWRYATARNGHLRLKNQSSTVATTSSNERVWCAYPRLFYGKGFERVHPDVCTQRSGTVTESANLAAYEHRRLKNQSRTVATTTSNSSTQVWCATKSSIWMQKNSSGCPSNAKQFSSKAQAQAEQFGLNRITTTSTSTTYAWCANASNVFQTTKAYCKSRKLESFPTKTQAEAEHLRLKNQSSTVATTSSNERVWCAYPRLFYGKGFERVHPAVCTQRSGVETESANLAAYEHRRLKNQSSTVATTTEVVESQSTEIDKSALELEFWKTIKDSRDPDMFREYLRQFPSGTFEGIAKIKIRKLGGTSTAVAKIAIPNLDFGDYYALVIGNNRYRNLRDLRSAVNDARAVSNLLEIDYGFDVELLENATRKDILRSLKRLRETVRSKDNVLIYYAGHGVLDQAADEGYWLPVDAERDDDSNWILTDRVTSQVKAMKAKHVMVVADSCFSGTLTRAIKIEQRTPEWLSEIVKKKARIALTSGGLEPVMDTGSGNHSAFAHAFITLLEENDSVLDGSQLFSKLRPKVMVNSTQTPQYGRIHMAGDDGGDFLFVKR